MTITTSFGAAKTRKNERVRRVSVILAVLTLLLFSLTLIVGQSALTPTAVIEGITGNTDAGTIFTVRELRLPRAALGLTAGFAFALAGSTSQTLLRNPLASPDIIGITSGASAFAVFAIVVLGASNAVVSLFALIGALGTAGAIFFLSNGAGFAGFRMILIGIGFAAMLNSLTQWVLSKSPSWDLQTAMRWLSGSLGAANWKMAGPLLLSTTAATIVLLFLRRHLDLLRLGDDMARGLGLQVTVARVSLIVVAVTLLATATAATGPIAFVAFMSGPIASRLQSGGRPPLLESGLVGACLVLGGDLVGQNLFAVHYPVGVITGLLGAPFLIYLLIRMNQGGGQR